MPKKGAKKVAQPASAIEVTESMLVSDKAASSADKVNIRRDEEYYIDRGNLLGIDHRPVDADAIKQDREGYILDRTRENTQLLLNAIWDLPIERLDNVYCAKLPEPHFRLPREKRIPEPKAPTRWEEYAASKGIQNKKRSRMVFDEETQEYRPRFGYKSVNNDEPAYIVLPDQADPYEDQFEKRAESKKARIQKNEKQRLRNLADARKSAEHSHAFKDRSAVKDKLTTAFAITKSSTASAGKFDRKLADEPKMKKVAGKGQKRSAVAGDMSAEKSAQLALLNKLQKKPITITTKKGTKLADTQRPGASGVEKRLKRAGKGFSATRATPKGPSKKQKKQM
eukprot:m.832176 g.832176  ORF g.832176 m.832176 type:complete len:339 (-) comp23434_c1_seq1:248-1264(-)